MDSFELKMFHFSQIQETKKRQAVEFLIKKKISSLIAACSFLHVRFLAPETYCTSTNGKYLLDLRKIQDLCLLNTQNFTHGVFTRANNINKGERSVIDYIFCTYDLLYNIFSFHINEMKEFTPWIRLKQEKRLLIIMPWS